MTLIAAAAEEARQAKIAVLLVPGIGTADDLRRAHDAGATMVRVATHCTEADVSRRSTSPSPGTWAWRPRAS
jgi:4-hydroxy 2-oxovalerate aldolase